MPMHKVKVIVPITGADEEAILKEVAAIQGTDADAVEWRFDLARTLYSFDSEDNVRDAEVYSAAETLQDVLKLLSERLEGRELLFTIRTRCQGGRFPNNDEAYEVVYRIGCDLRIELCLHHISVFHFNCNNG